MQVDLHVLAAVFLVAYTVQSVAGFGGAVVSLAIGAQLMPIPAMMPYVIWASVVQCAAIALRDRRHVEGRVLLARVLPLMGAGTALGYALGGIVEPGALKRGFGVFVILLASRELWAAIRRTAPRSPRRGVVPAAMGAAGVMHGLFATGGPLLVFALSQLGLSPRAFRATLASVFVTLNLALTVAMVLSGRIGRETVPGLAVVVAVLAVTLYLGERIFARVDPARFRVLVFSLLLLAGLALVVR